MNITIEEARELADFDHVDEESRRY